MESLFLIVDAAGERLAVPALEVESVVTSAAIVPAPLAASHVAGLAALRSRVLTMIDVGAATGGRPREDRDCCVTVIVPVEGQLYGLMVDAVHDVVTVAEPPAPVGAAIAPGWAAAARGIIETAGGSALVVDPAELIRGPALTA